MNNQNRATEQAWREYAIEAGYEDAGEWTSEEVASWAAEIMEAADEAGFYEGISPEMDEWARA